MKKGRKTIREVAKDKVVLLRLTAEEKAIFEQYARTRNRSVSAMIIDSIYSDMLKRCYSIPVEHIHKLGLPIKQNK